jgi:predicted pyridoxine 5'-phosphate oxidase superfamily flavin-nucleotide-binding protein
LNLEYSEYRAWHARTQHNEKSYSEWLSPMHDESSFDVAFTPAVKAIQERRGSRGAYAKLEERGGFGTVVTPELEQFIASRNSFYLGTASADGRPYIQHKGGPKGFLKVLDERTLAFADYNGNRQYISLGNLLRMTESSFS